MRRIFTSIIALFCICSVAWAQHPTVTATVTTTGDLVTYNYTLNNTTAYDVWQLAIFMPSGATDTITSYATSQQGWTTLIRKAEFDMICWDRQEAGVIAPGASADFSFTTAIGVQTTNTFSGGTSSGSSNWSWWNGTAGGGGEGNSIVPVPASVPEPSSIAALGIGLLPFGTCLVKKRRQTN